MRSFKVVYFLVSLFLAEPVLASDYVIDDEVSIGDFELEEHYRWEDIETVQAVDKAVSEMLENDHQYLWSPMAPPKVNIAVNKTKQRMNVCVNGEVVHRDWKVSTGRKGHETRSGIFTPFEMSVNYFSKFFQVILPYGIKFDGGNLIHAASTGGVFWLGQKRSAGCVRVHPANAKKVYKLVQTAGMRNTRVVVFSESDRQITSKSYCGKPVKTMKQEELPQRNPRRETSPGEV